MAQERVTPQNTDDFADVVVQYHPDHGTVGVGLEPQSDVPSQHLIDRIYGGVPTQTNIGRIFATERWQELGITGPSNFKSKDAEAEFYNQLGRAILDAVIGSYTLDGMWTWLDRSGCNRLIRLLRKGRDISFGRDE